MKIDKNLAQIMFFNTQQYQKLLLFDNNFTFATADKSNTISELIESIELERLSIIKRKIVKIKKESIKPVQVFFIENTLSAYSFILIAYLFGILPLFVAFLPNNSILSLLVIPLFMFLDYHIACQRSRNRLIKLFLIEQLEQKIDREVARRKTQAVWYPEI